MQPATNKELLALDLIRGLAAFVVMAGHLRAFIFTSFANVTHANPALRAFYLLTSFGHDAVIVFFVLSGFLVGRHVRERFVAGRWSWRGYAVRRLTRLWIVLIPALVLTGAFDWVGIHVLHGEFYSGSLSGVYHCGPELGAPNYAVSTFGLNLIFLQTVVAPTFGSNGPLWSLANRSFEYYVIFPLGFLATRRPARGFFARVAYALAALVLCWILPTVLVAYGLVWLLGYGIARLDETCPLTQSPRLRRVVQGASVLVFFGALCATHVWRSSPALADGCCSVAFGALLYGVCRADIQSFVVRRASLFFSRISYTMYLVHFPFVACVVVAILSGRVLEPSSLAFAMYFGVLIAAVVFSVLVYACFEKHTGRIQRWLLVRVKEG